MVKKTRKKSLKVGIAMKISPIKRYINDSVSNIDINKYPQLDSFFSISEVYFDIKTELLSRIRDLKKIQW